VRCLQGHPGLADPARTYHRDKAGARGVELLHRGNLLVPTYKAAQGHRHRSGPSYRRGLKLADAFLGYRGEEEALRQ
jgi:hypothetical protein